MHQAPLDHFEKEELNNISVLDMLLYSKSDNKAILVALISFATCVVISSNKEYPIPLGDWVFGIIGWSTLAWLGAVFFHFFWISLDHLSS